MDPTYAVSQTQNYVEEEKPVSLICTCYSKPRKADPTANHKSLCEWRKQEKKELQEIETSIFAEDKEMEQLGEQPLTLS